MKNSFFKAAGVLSTLALALTFAACKDQPKAAGTSTAATPEKETIVFVNSDSLLNNYEYFKTIKAKIEGKAKTAQSDLQAKGTAYQREVAQYQQAAAGMSADQRAATEEKLARKQQELAAYNQNASNALANDQAAENEKLYERVAAYLKNYAKQKGYKMVLTYSKQNPTVLFGDESLDVTKEVVSGLNAEYKKDGNK